MDKDISLDLSKHNGEQDQMILVDTKLLTKEEDWKVYHQGRRKHTLEI